MKKNMTREMVIIAFPMMVSMACDTVMIFTDRVFLSRLSPELMNAAMGGGLTSFMMLSFFFGLIGYTTALAAQYLGARRKDRCAVVLTQAVIIALLAYFPVLLCRPLAHGFFHLMGVPAIQLGPQKLYFDILLYGCIITLLRHTFSSFFSGIGRTRVVMGAATTAMIVNVILNYIFVFGKFGCPAMGIQGAAYGTLIGSASGLGVLITAYFSRKIREEFGVLRALVLDRDVLGRLWKFGSSTGIEFFLNILAFNALVLIFHANGPVTATAATIVLNWDMVSFVPLIGIEIGVTSLVGRAMGAGDPDKAHQAAMAGVRLGAVFSAPVFLFFVFAPGLLVNVFRPDVPVETFLAAVPLATVMIRMAALYVLIESLFLAMIGALRGAGDTRWAMFLSVAVHWVSAIALFIALRVLHWNAIGAWACVVVVFVLGAIGLWLRYRDGKWRTMKVVDEPPVILPDASL